MAIHHFSFTFPIIRTYDELLPGRCFIGANTPSTTFYIKLQPDSENQMNDILASDGNTISHVFTSEGKIIQIDNTQKFIMLGILGEKLEFPMFKKYDDIKEGEFFTTMSLLLSGCDPKAWTLLKPEKYLMNLLKMESSSSSFKDQCVSISGSVVAFNDNERYIIVGKI
jgi:hypothetical protein